MSNLRKPPRPTGYSVVLDGKPSPEEVTRPDNPRARGTLDPVSDGPPVSHTPAPWERDSTVDAIEQQVAKRGDKVVRPGAGAESTPLPEVASAGPELTPSVMARADRIPLAKWLIIIGTASAGVAAVLTAFGQMVAVIITSYRPPTNAELEKKLTDKIEAVEQRVNAGSGIAIEAKARMAKDEEIERVVERHDAQLKQLMPAATIQGLPPQK